MDTFKLIVSMLIINNNNAISITKGSKVKFQPLSQPYPRCCIAAGYNNLSMEGCVIPSGLRFVCKVDSSSKVTEEQLGGPLAHSLLCSKHFELNCFASE